LEIHCMSDVSSEVDAIEVDTVEINLTILYEDNFKYFECKN